MFMCLFSPGVLPGCKGTVPVFRLTPVSARPSKAGQRGDAPSATVEPEAPSATVEPANRRGDPFELQNVPEDFAWKVGRQNTRYLGES